MRFNNLPCKGKCVFSYVPFTLLELDNIQSADAHQRWNHTSLNCAVCAPWGKTVKIIFNTYYITDTPDLPKKYNEFVKNFFLEMIKIIGVIKKVPP